MSNNIHLIGSYEVSLDAKGRFMLPKTYKDQLPEGHKEEFVLTTGFEKCLKLYPKSEFLKVCESFNKYPTIDREIDKWRRSFNANADMLILDGAGRLNISKKLLEKADLRKNIKLISLGNVIEVWELENYEAYEAQEDDLDTLTKKNQSREFKKSEQE
jgi:MraZ protein